MKEKKHRDYEKDPKNNITHHYYSDFGMAVLPAAHHQ